MKSSTLSDAGWLQGATTETMKNRNTLETKKGKKNTNIILGVISYNWPASNRNRFGPPHLSTIIL